jgi:AraC-like DNA-binding protein
MHHLEAEPSGVQVSFSTPDDSPGIEPIRSEDRFLADVEVAVASMLQRPRVSATARAVGVSRRTLQRLLEKRGTTHQNVVDDARRNLATHLLLTHSSLSMAKIAHQLGFGDVTAFHRAFRRWTGTSPRRFSDAPSLIDTVDVAPRPSAVPVFPNRHEPSLAASG